MVISKMFLLLFYHHIFYISSTNKVHDQTKEISNRFQIMGHSPQMRHLWLPFPVITWSRPLKQLPVNRHIISGNKLTIKDTTEDDDGAYLCQELMS